MHAYLFLVHLFSDLILTFYLQDLLVTKAPSLVTLCIVVAVTAHTISKLFFSSWTAKHYSSSQTSIKKRKLVRKKTEEKKPSAKAVQQTQQKYKSPYPKAAASYAQTDKNRKNNIQTAKLTDRKTETKREPENTRLPAR